MNEVEQPVEGQDNDGDIGVANEVRAGEGVEEVNAAAAAANNEAGGQAQAQGQAQNDDVNWNLMEWDRAEELTWERLLGLDGSLVFLEHVFWVASLNTLFILVFGNHLIFHYLNFLFEVSSLRPDLKFFMIYDLIHFYFDDFFLQHFARIILATLLLSVLK